MNSLRILLATIVCIALGLPGKLCAEERRPYLSFTGLHVIAQRSDSSPHRSPSGVGMGFASMVKVM